MAVKKTKRPALRYLVSADAKLRKLSMKKVTEGDRKPTVTKRPGRTKAPAEPPAQSLRWPWATSARTMSLAVVGVVIAATLITATQMSDSSGSSAPLVSGARFAGASTDVAPSPVRVEKSAPSAKRRPDPTAPAAVESPAPTPVAAATPVTDADAVEAVTVTGCLAKNGTAFVLKDAAGAALPKTRSWRSGFFKKSLPRLNVVASAGVQLAGFDGERVSITGSLAERELRARSVRRVAATCN